MCARHFLLYLDQVTPLAAAGICPLPGDSYGADSPEEVNIFKNVYALKVYCKISSLFDESAQKGSPQWFALLIDALACSNPSNIALG